MEIRTAVLQDLPALSELACRLWPGHTEKQMMEEYAVLMNSADAVFALALDGEKPVGFVQCQLRRDYVEGTETSPVGYLEGIYVLESARNQGVARALLRCCEHWAVEHGCSEFASDCELDNLVSQQFHQKLGFEEANRIVCYAKKLM